MTTRLDRLRQQLRDLETRRETERTELLDLANADELTDDDEARYGELAPRFTAVDGQPAWAEDDNIERLRREIGSLEVVERGFEVGTVERHTSSLSLHMPERVDSLAFDAEFRSPEVVRDLALRAAEVDIPEISDANRDEIARKLRTVETSDGRLSRHVIATSRPEYRSAFNKMVAASLHGSPLSNLTETEMRAVESVRAAGLGGTSGGLAVPTPLDPTIILTGAHDGVGNVWRSVCNVVSTTANTWNGVTSAGITVGYGAEAAEATDNAPTLAAATITCNRGRGLVPFSIEIEQDWSAMQTEMMRLFAIAKDDSDEAVFASSAAPAANTPIGFVYDVLTNFAAQLLTSATTDTFAIADVYNLHAGLSRRFRANGSWMANILTYSLIRRFDTQGGAGLLEYLGNALPGTLLGRPMYESPTMDGVINAAAENYMLLFGDFKSAFYIADRLGTTVELIPHLFGATSRFPTGQRGLFLNWRTGTKTINAGAVRLLNVT